MRMLLVESFRLSFESLRANGSRSALTMLGMIIGVAAVVLLVSLGTGAKSYIFSQFESMGTNLVMVQPGKTDKKSSFGPPIGSAQRKMTLADVRALERNALNLEAVSGVVLGTTTIRFENNLSNVSVLGCSDSIIRVLNFKVADGAFYSREEDEYGRRVVVLGSDIATNIFGNSSAIGQSVKIHQSEFRVVGVLQKSGHKLGFDIDDFVFIPTTAALRLFNEDKLFGIRAKARSRAAVDDLVEEIRDILSARRHGEEDFTIITQVAMMESMETILNMLTYVLGGIACISMLVGGIGIMNIMIVSVAERTSEIGVRRAVGARRRDILTQFLIEATVLSFLGGALGLIIALVITQTAYQFFPSFDLRAPFWILPIAFGLSAVVGVLFGVWPAFKASRIETLEALRHE
jgi:putative ABC transport system permease protein